MDATPLFFSWGEERMHDKPFHLSSGPRVSSTLVADIATGSSQGLVLAQCKLARKNVYSESWWSCWLPLWCPLPSSPQGEHPPYQGTIF